MMLNNIAFMSKNKCIATYSNGYFKITDNALIPLYLARTGDIEGWLEHRAIDRYRTNSRLLKKVLRLEEKDDISTVLHSNAATITDTYWVKSSDSNLTYEDVQFKYNYFDALALRGDPDSFNQLPSRTPELTNTGSFEKCWRLVDNKWWMYKQGTVQEQFTELFAYYLAKELEIPVALYEKDAGYVRTLDFTDGATVNFESAFSLIGEDANYSSIYRKLKAFDTKLADSYVRMLFFDGLIFNMDRHEHNWGFLRDVDTGGILGMAPLYDHNIALITRGFPSSLSRENDLLIKDFLSLIHEEGISFIPPKLTSQMVSRAVSKALVGYQGVLPENTSVYITNFIMNGYARLTSGC